jgi:hypothetical protein
MNTYIHCHLSALPINPTVGNIRIAVNLISGFSE